MGAARAFQRFFRDLVARDERFAELHRTDAIGIGLDLVDEYLVSDLERTEFRDMVNRKSLSVVHVRHRDFVAFANDVLGRQDEVVVLTGLCPG